MKTSIPCPQCKIPITLEDFEDFKTPFTMRCPNCGTKLKETRVTPILILLFLCVLPPFIWLTDFIIETIAGYVPAIEKIPSSLVALGLLYPVLALYERFNGLIMFNRGNMQVKHTYDDFWKWFANHSDEYYSLKEENQLRLIDNVEKQLSKVNPYLNPEFSVDLEEGKREFYISANGVIAAFSAVEGLVKAAPIMDNFRIVAFSQRGDSSFVQIDDIELRPKDIFFSSDSDGDTLELTLFVKNLDSENEDWEHAVDFLLNRLIGEYDLATKISGVEILPYNPYEDNRFLSPIIKLPDQLDDLERRKIREQSIKLE